MLSETSTDQTELLKLISTLQDQVAHIQIAYAVESYQGSLPDNAPTIEHRSQIHVPKALVSSIFDTETANGAGKKGNSTAQDREKDQPLLGSDTNTGETRSYDDGYDGDDDSSYGELTDLSTH